MWAFMWTPPDSTTHSNTVAGNVHLRFSVKDIAREVREANSLYIPVLHILSYCTTALQWFSFNHNSSSHLLEVVPVAVLLFGKKTNNSCLS